MALNINGTTGISGVDGSVSAPAVTGTDSNTGITFPSADTIKFSTGGVERMAITNSGISGITSGITLADQWRITADFTGGAVPIQNNWERNDNGWSQLGTGFSAPSSGVFSFPSSGYYWIRFQAHYGWTSSTNYIAFIIQYTSNNSSYNGVSRVITNINNVSGTTYGGANTDVMLKITDITNQKIRATCVAYIGNETFSVNGSSTEHLTGFTFLRMGDI